MLDPVPFVFVGAGKVVGDIVWSSLRTLILKCRQLSKASKLLIFASTQNSTNGGSRDSDVKVRGDPDPLAVIVQCGDDRHAGRKTPYSVQIFSDRWSLSFLSCKCIGRETSRRANLSGLERGEKRPLGVGTISKPGDLGRFQ